MDAYNLKRHQNKHAQITPQKKNKVLALNPSMQHLTKEGERSCILFEKGVVFYS
jgi:hypothetical protein